MHNAGDDPAPPMKRAVVPEILDHLDSADPAAVRSRRDLRRINWLMGNFRWLERALRELGSPTSLVEVGCGDGRFISQLAARGWKDLTAVDLAPPPPDLPENVTWLQQDVSSALAGTRGGILVANLFWHLIKPCIT